jgi:uncharacterized protein
MTCQSHGLANEELNMLYQALEPFQSEVTRVGLFGSRATGRYRANSDIDLVLYGPVSDGTLGRIYTLLNDCALPVTVDVQAYDLISYAPLKEHIDRVMLPLFDFAA